MRRGGASVGFYSVTSCDADFRPTFRLASGGVLTLHRATLSSLRHLAYRVVAWVPADAFPAAYVVSHWPSHPQNFKTFAWGIDGACETKAADAFATDAVKYLAIPFGGMAPVTRLPVAVGRRHPINTFAEWGPTEADWPRKHFQIGPDEVAINTASGRCVVGCVGVR